jgi:multiple sugar transport system permease protein
LTAIVATLVVLAIGFVMVFPFYWMVTSSLKSAFDVSAFPPVLFPTDLQWGNYWQVFFGSAGAVTFSVPFAQMYFNSLYIAVLNVVLTVFVSSLAGYAFARIRFPGRTALLVILLSALLMPMTALLIPLFIIYRDLGWLGTHLPLIFGPPFGAPAIVGTFVMRQFFLGIPSELEDAGRLDGLGRLGILRHIALPLSRPAIASVVILTFLASWDMFIEPLVFVGTPPQNLTVSVGLTQYVDVTSYPVYQVQMAATTLSMLPILIVFVFAQRQFIQGIARVGIHG